MNKFLLKTSEVTKYFILVVVALVVLKLLLIPWSAHPFDFWAFANTFQRHTLYGWDLFEYWNKGVLLIGIWYPPFALYTKLISLLGISGDSVVLMHLMLKLPFLFLDILSGYLLLRIVQRLSGNVQQGRIAFLMWFANPLVYYVYGVHGHYELLVPFALILLIWGLLKNNGWAIGLSLVIAFTTKYFIVILVPLILVFLIKNRCYRAMLQAMATGVVGTVLSYVHVIFNPILAKQILGSIISLSQSNSPIGVTKLTLPPLNIFAFFNFFLSPRNPINNIDWPSIFNIVNQGLKMVTVLVVVHTMIRAYLVFGKKHTYSVTTLLQDILATLVYLLLLSTNFQAHYISWLIPLLTVLAILNRQFLLLLLGLTLSGFAFAYKNEVGPRTFFMDIIDSSNISYFNNVSSFMMYLIGSVIVFLLICVVIILLGYQSKSKFRLSLHQYLIGLSLLWVLLLPPFGGAISDYFSIKKHRNVHAFVANSGLHRGVIVGQYKVREINNTRIEFSNEENTGMLMLEEIPRLSGRNRMKFNLFVISDRPYSELGLSKLNGCTVLHEGVITNLIDHKDYSSYQFDINCLGKENELEIVNGQQLDKDQTILYISNRKFDYAYEEELGGEINTFALIGLVYCLGIAYGSWYLIRSIYNSD